MNAPGVPRLRMKVAEFLAWADTQARGHYELVDGEIIAMSAEQARHNLVKLAATLALRDAILAAKLPCTVFTDGMSVVIDDQNTREPDASVLGGVDVNLDSMILEAPMIVVEVASPSSERLDTQTKLVDYFLGAEHLSLPDHLGGAKRRCSSPAGRRRRDRNSDHARRQYRAIAARDDRALCRVTSTDNSRRRGGSPMSMGVRTVAVARLGVALPAFRQARF